MTIKNPKKALNVVNAAAGQVGTYQVQELTLGMAGILEAIRSPLYLGTRPESIADWAPTLYAMVQTPAENRVQLARGRADYLAAAQEWADALPLPVARGLIGAVTATLTRLTDVMPESEGGESGGNPTAAGPMVG